MRLLTKLATLAVAVATAAIALASPAAAAPTYWKFRNVEKDMCLTAGSSAVAYIADCKSTDYQLWDWLDNGDSHKRLRNKATNRCLVTDLRSSLNSVWTGTCDADADGQRWYYGNEFIAVRWGNWLRTSPKSAGGVYTAGDYLTMDDWTVWKGTHT